METKETKFKIDEEVYILVNMSVTKGTIVGITKKVDKMDDGSVAEETKYVVKHSCIHQVGGVTESDRDESMVFRNEYEAAKIILDAYGFSTELITKFVEMDLLEFIGHEKQ